MSFDLGSAISGAISGFAAVGGGYQGIAGAIAGFFIGGFAGGDAKRSARNKARDAYNAAQKDRAQMVQSATAPHNIVYGEALVSGPLAYAETSADTGTYLHLIVLLAAHEVDAIGEVYLGDEPVGTLDDDGYSTSTSTFWRHATSTVSEGGTGGTLTLSHTPTRIISVATDGYGAYEGAWGQLINSTIDGNVVTFDPPLPGTLKYVTYEYDSGTPLVRIKKHLGSPDQTADATLIAEGSGTWTADHRLRGIAYLYIRLQYDQDIFGAIGIPNVRAVVRGRKVYDPRTSTTAWSDNAALCTADYLRTYMQADAAEVPDAELSTAADICDQLVTLDIGGATERRYTANGVLSTESPCKDNLDALTEAMAGAVPYVQGRFLIRAGAHLSSSLTITEDMIADGGVEIPQTDTPRTEQTNRIVAKYVEPAKTYTTVEATPVTNATYVAADGGQDLPLDITYDLCTGALRAQRLAKIALERARQGMRVVLTCNLRAYDVAPTDVVAVALARYGWAGKLFEVESRSIDLSAGTITLSLRETAADVWDWNFGEATVVDLTPNTTLTSPFERPAELTGIAIASGTPHLAISADGTVITRGYITWTQSSSIWVLQGGKVEIESIYADQDAASQWQRHPEADGSATSAYIAPLTDGRPTIVRLRPRTAAGKRGPWAALAFVPTGKTEPPANVTGAAATQVTGGVRIAWSKPVDLDYAATEWRLGADFSSGTRLFRGSATDFVWLAPPQGSHTLSAVHWDTSGNPSATPATLSVTVDVNGLVQWSGINGRPKTFRVVAMGSSATSAPASPNLFDADTGSALYSTVDRSYQLVRISRATGAITFSRSYDVFGAGTSVGSGAGHTAATLAADLDATNNDSIVVVWTYDEPRNSRLSSGMDAAMYRCGASRAVFGSPEFKFRSAYALVGIGGCGEGNGCEVYQGSIDADPDAWCDVSFLITSSGQLIVSGTSATPRTLADYSYVGDLDATNGAPAGTEVAGTDAATVRDNAANALSNAATAQSSANSALSSLATMRSNGYLDAAEKPALIREWNALANEQSGIDAQATAYGITAEKSAYDSAISSLASYLTGLSPSWSDTTTDTPITPATDQATWLAAYTTRQALLNKIAEVAGTKASWTGVTARPVTFRAVSRGANDTASPAGVGLYDAETGALLVGGVRSYNMARISRSTRTITFAQHYDVFAEGTDAGNPAGYGRGAAELAADLNATGPTDIVVVWTNDEPLGHRLDSGLEAAMYYCGASRAVFGSPQFKFRSAYALVGIGGCGEGNGFEAYQGDVNSSTDAWCDLAFMVTAQGQLVGPSTSATPRTLADYSYTGDLDATRGSNGADFSGVVGGENLLANSDMQRLTSFRPLGFQAYAFLAAPVWVDTAGYLGGKAAGVKATAADSTYSTLGMLSNSTVVEGGVTGGVEGGWKANQAYTISFVAKKVSGAGWGGTRLAWNTSPATVTTVANPTLTTTWQRYVFRITWGATVESNGGFFISMMGNVVAVNDEIHIDQIMICEGDVAPQWSASRRDSIGAANPLTTDNVDAVVSGGTIGTVHLGANAATVVYTLNTDLAGATIANVTNRWRASMSITPDVNCVAEVEATVVCKMDGGGDSGRYMFLGADPAPTGTGIASGSVVTGGAQSPDLTVASNPQVSIPLRQQFSLAAGTTYDVGVLSTNSVAFSNAIPAWAINLTVNLIKR